MALDDNSMPLPILLRVPWFPPDPEPAVVLPEVQVVESSASRPFPLVVHRNVQTARSPMPAPRSARRKSWLLILLLVAGLIGTALSWHRWPRRLGEDSQSTSTRDKAVSENSPNLGVESTPHRAAYLCPEIIPLDSGETP
jgi:hypothetical protein